MSSPDQDYDPAEAHLVIVRSGEGHWSCRCGCGAHTNANSRFRMGHDQRLRGILIRAHLAGVSIEYSDAVGDLVRDYEAIELAREMGWTQSLLDAQKRKIRAVEDLITRATRAGVQVQKSGTATIAVYNNRVEMVTTLGRPRRLKTKPKETA